MMDLYDLTILDHSHIDILSSFQLNKKNNWDSTIDLYCEESALKSARVKLLYKSKQHFYLAYIQNGEILFLNGAYIWSCKKRVTLCDLFSSRRRVDLVQFKKLLSVSTNLILQKMLQIGITQVFYVIKASHVGKLQRENLKKKNTLADILPVFNQFEFSTVCYINAGTLPEDDFFKSLIKNTPQKADLVVRRGLLL